jgi:hypothetical protein
VVDSILEVVGAGMDDETFFGGGPEPLSGRSSGMSIFGAPLSECNPTGLNGSRNLPLFGLGSIPSESQMMLYTSMFSRHCQRMKPTYFNTY